MTEGTGVAISGLQDTPSNVAIQFPKPRHHTVSNCKLPEPVT